MTSIKSSVSIESYYKTHFLQAPTRAEVSPNRGLLSRPLVPYVLVVKSSMVSWSDTHTARPLASQQRRLLETPGQCCMLASFQLHRVREAISVNRLMGTLWWATLLAR